MLSFDIRSLEDHAATVDGELRATDPVWIEGDMLPEAAVRATGRLSIAGPGRYYWSGAIAGTATVALPPVSRGHHGPGRRERARALCGSRG